MWRRAKNEEVSSLCRNCSADNILYIVAARTLNNETAYVPSRRFLRVVTDAKLYGRAILTALREYFSKGSVWAMKCADPQST